VKVTLLNFTVNADGLEDQLLGIVVSKERPDLEEMKSQLVQQNARQKKELKEIENQILKLLAESEGDILDDETLITTLAQSKETSEEINEKLKEAEITEKEIDHTRNLYRPVALRGSLLFFAVADMSTVDPMYQFSLQWFIDLFIRSIEDSPSNEDISVRCLNLIDFFTFALYKNVCRALFAAHKLLFSFTMCIKIMQNQGKIDPDEWRFLLTASTGNEMPLENPVSEWLVEKNWIDIIYLARLPNFKGIDEDFASIKDEWKALFDSNTCHSDPLPGKWNDELDLFQKMLIIRCLRPDKLEAAISNFIDSSFDARFIDPPVFNLGAAFEDSTSVVPLVFVLTAGADPVSDLLKFADEMGFSEKLQSISLGQGQGPLAEQMIAKSCAEGHWVLLQNCHLAVSWMSRMEATVEAMDPTKIKSDFRLWLSSMPSTAFPVSVLQNSVKMTMEPPKGLRANLNGSFAEFDDEYLSTSKKPLEFRKLLFSLCFFHAVVQERRKFGPLGWNISYDFTAADLKCCTSQLQVFLDKYETVPYKVITFLSGHINYGGRVTDDWDRRTMMTTLATYISDSVLEKGYTFSESGTYYCPDSENAQGFLDYIKELPLYPHPEVFGLHENADITCAQNEVQELFATILSLQARVASATGKSEDDVIAETSSSILEQLPHEVSMIDLVKQYPVQYEESMNTVLQQEVLRYNKLLKVMRTSLVDIQKALKGLVVMSGSLEQMGLSLFNNQVPDMWASAAYPSLKPLSMWVVDLVHRMQFINKWIDLGVPSTYWISGFFFPQAFLTGTLQNFARKYQVSIDTVSFEFKIQDTPEDQLTRKPDDGCYIYGLFLEGARWEGGEVHSLEESRPKELFTPMAVIWLLPISNREIPLTGFYKCPCYKVLTRKGTLSTTGHSTNFVVSMEVPSNVAQEQWIKRGVALFCSLAY
jgi:dynein heavy chain